MIKLSRVIVLVLCTAFFISCSGSKSEMAKNNLKEENLSEVYDTLVFTSNESFFSPVGGLLANQRDKTSGTEYNKFEYYDYVHNWKTDTDTVIFGIDVNTKGDLIIHPEMGIPENQDKSLLNVYLGDQFKTLTLHETGSESAYQIQEGVTFKNVETGFYEIKLQLKKIQSLGQDIGKLNKLHLTGSAIKHAKNRMRRYRAKAIHCKWKTSSNNPIVISVHELSIHTKSVGYYQPITTPFGYTGSTWNKDTQTFGGYNFSLWSYGANDPVPPFYQESHLVAVGPGLTFGSYGHEGTGVKPRGDHPYLGVNTHVQTIAVRKEPGKIYDTYWSYYLDPLDNHWKLYGCGKKYNKSGDITYLTTGAFVEVPGPASKVRSGHQVCETHYRGWQFDTSGNWHPINTMIGTTGLNGLSFRDWKIVNNKFSMQMGGWGEPDIRKKTLSISNPDEAPYYLKGEYLKELYKMPASFTHNGSFEILNNTAKFNFNVKDLGTNAKATVFWGTEEGLTKEDKWQNSKSIPIDNGNNILRLDNLIQGTDYFYRIKIQNEEGITWSLNTQKFKTVK